MNQYLTHLRCLLGCACLVPSFGPPRFDCGPGRRARGLALSLPSGRLKACGSSCFRSSGETTTFLVRLLPVASVSATSWPLNFECPAPRIRRDLWGPATSSLLLGLIPLSSCRQPLVLVIFVAAMPPRFFWKGGEEVTGLAWHQERVEDQEGCGESGAQPLRGEPVRRPAVQAQRLSARLSCHWTRPG